MASIQPHLNMSQDVNDQRLFTHTYHRAMYGGRIVVVDFATEKIREFGLATRLIRDARCDGFVISPQGNFYEVKPNGSRPRYMDHTPTLLKARELFLVIAGDELTR